MVTIHVHICTVGSRSTSAAYQYNNRYKVHTTGALTCSQSYAWGKTTVKPPQFYNHYTEYKYISLIMGHYLSTH